MDKLSKQGRFDYNGKSMPVEYVEICKDPRLQEGIKNRKSFSHRFFNTISRYLKYDYKGDLPKDIVGVAQKLNYDKYICDLFYMSEAGFKNVHPDKYADFFENKSYEQQKDLFIRADWGGRSVFEYMQDVLSGNLIEDMFSHHTKDILSPNKKASGRGNDEVNTYCDYIFRNPPRPGKPTIEVPVELKTKWDREIEKEPVVKVRGSCKKIKETGGMILVLYPRLNKAALIDISGKDYLITRGKMGDKDCDIIHIDNDDIVDFVFWEYNDIKMMMNKIYDQFISRNK